jgi:hypothetical protein
MESPRRHPTSPRGHLYVPVASLVVVLSLLPGCMIVPTSPSPDWDQSKTTLISNQENTEFVMRPVGGDWRVVGKAKILQIPVRPGQWYEVAAKAPRYALKSMTVQAPLREMRFTYLIEDLEINQPENQVFKKAVVEVDIYTASVATGEVAPVAAHARSRGLAESFDDLMANCASQIAQADALQDKCVAVLSFQEGRGAEGLASHARTKLTWRLMSLGIHVMEREKLKQVLDERKLTESDIAKDPKRLNGVLPVYYIIRGDISVLRD